MGSSTSTRINIRNSIGYSISSILVNDFRIQGFRGLGFRVNGLGFFVKFGTTLLCNRVP